MIVLDIAVTSSVNMLMSQKEKNRCNHELNGFLEFRANYHRNLRKLTY